jgi:hypothetical protein
VHEAGAEPLQQLLLAEDDLDLVANTLWDVTRAVVRPRAADLPDEEPAAPPGAAADDEQEQPQDNGAYRFLTLLSSALIAGTISWRSPITA